MSRVNTTVKNILDEKTIQCFEAAYIDIDGGVYITNAPINFNHAGHTFVSLGNFLGFSNIEETSKFQVSNITISLSGIPAYDSNDQSFISQFLEHDYVDRRVTIYRAFFSNDQFVDAIIIFSGRMDNPVINDQPGQDTVMSVETVNNWVDYERRGGRHTNDTEHQSFYAGDAFFKYAADTIKDIKWAP